MVPSKIQRSSFKERQRGFRNNIDGCRDNILMLDYILKQQNQLLKPLYMASLDVEKAFPSVSPKALLEGIRAFGAPDEFMSYMSFVYANGYTILHGQNWHSGRLVPCRGVLQGDPLSSPLFNILRHKLLKELPKETGIRVGGEVVNATAFVDDINLYAETPRGLQLMIKKASDFMHTCGISFNIDKSFTLGFRPSGRDKITTLDIST